MILHKTDGKIRKFPKKFKSLIDGLDMKKSLTKKKYALLILQAKNLFFAMIIVVLHSYPII